MFKKIKIAKKKKGKILHEHSIIEIKGWNEQTSKSKTVYLRWRGWILMIGKWGVGESDNESFCSWEWLCSWPLCKKTARACMVYESLSFFKDISMGVSALCTSKS